MPGTQVLTEDFTCVSMEEAPFDCENIIEDTLTGGYLFETKNYPLILNSEGLFNRPPRLSMRDCKDKKCFIFSPLGYYQTLGISEEHCIFVLDGKNYRKKLKLSSCKEYRKSKGIKPNGVKKINLPNNLIKRVKAQDVKSDDYLLTPTPKLGNVSIDKDLAWLIGFCVADGCLCFDNNSYHVTFTGCKDELSLSRCKEILEEKFEGKISSYKHGDGKGWRVSSTTKNAYNFFKKYIANKGLKKKFTKEVFNLDKESRLNLLAGYFDGDGSFSKEKKIVANCYSKDLSDQIFWISISCEIACSLKKYPLYGDHYKTEATCAYRMHIPSSQVLNIARFMNGDKVPVDFIPKKERDLRFFYEEDGIKYLAQPIDKIEEFLFTGKGYDIEMTNDRHALVASGYVCSNCRFFYENEPKVAAGIDFYSQFPMNGFKLSCKNKKIMKFYEKMIKRIKLDHWLRLISFEYHLFGDVFPFVEFECAACHNTGMKPNGAPCNHPGGDIKRIVVMNPDWIMVHSSPLASDPVFTLEPDDELKGIIAEKKPAEIYNRLPKSLINAIMTSQPIQLANRCISHIKHQGSPYGAFGVSMIRRLFTYLAYKMKLMTANWIVAERLILPIRIVKIGDKDRPASQADISDVSTQLTYVANDPNLTLVTHHAFEMTWEGATGKIHNITQELEQIGKEILDGLMLNQAILSGEMGCHDEETLTLTDGGYKKYDQITEKDKIGCYDKKTNKIKYYHYLQKHVYDYDGEMVHFKNNMMDIMVTPNHRMWNKKRHSDHFEFVEAKDVGTRSHFLNRIEGFDGKHKEKITIGKNKYFVKDLCELVGWYISEGSTASEKRENRKKQITTINISQNKLENREKIYTLCRNMFLSGYKTKSSINVYSSEMAEWLRENCGDHSYTKKIPQWIKNLDSSYLKILLGTYLDGDGSWNNEAKYGERFPRAWTSSDQLADDIEEVAFKCGYSVKRGIRTKEAMSKGYVNKQGYEFITRKDQHIIYFSDGRKGKEVILDSRDKDYQNKIISKVAYKGKVYCFTVPTGLFVTKRNNKITIQGNSYSSAQVGIEILIRRLDNWRNILSEWVENHIFLPVAMMQGFIDEEKSEDSDEKEYLYPTIEWNDMQLRDKSNERQSYMQLHDKGVISTQTLLEKFDLDWDKEIQRKREEQVMASATGMVLGPLQGGAGGAGGGMGGLDLGGLGGGGGGGGMPPGGDMGAGGAPGGMPPGAAPGGQTGGMGASPAGGSPGGVGTVAAAQQVSPMPNFIGRRGEKRKADEQQEVQPVQTKVIELTKLEQKLLRTLTGMSGKIPYKLFGQYQVKLPNQPQPFVMDFAYPAVGVGVEADGERWHEEIDSKIRDQQRDQKLANVGWRILRFKEEAINNNIDNVARVIYSNVIEAAKDHAQRNKQADSNPEIKKIAEQIKNIETLDKDILKYDRIDIPGDLGYIYLIGI